MAANRNPPSPATPTAGGNAVPLENLDIIVVEEVWKQIRSSSSARFAELLAGSECLLAQLPSGKVAAFCVHLGQVSAASRDEATGG